LDSWWGWERGDKNGNSGTTMLAGQGFVIASLFSVDVFHQKTIDFFKRHLECGGSK